MIQGSTEWHMARLGRVTASRVADVIAKTKTGPAATRANYMAQLICERLSGQPTETYSNAAMQWGTEKEPEARDAYAFLRNVDVDEIGFVDHPRIAMSGASPDGLIGDDGLLEIKCPQTATHLETLLGRAAPAKYVTQMQWQMACTGRAWTDFVSFDPRLPDHLRLFVTRIERDDAAIEAMEAEVIAFLVELDAKLSDLARAYPAPLAVAA